ncbi:minor tail protein [Mycobacterium phage DroogsArmy]|uniref:Minor tail protein n=1 Tax=Mycobacterium phage DroogsArmy TaxID=2744011 RepID=A0A6N0A6H6_9CAUD|nr:minor tail protein [Mycobacterium phage DroogsArmy]QKO02428.1 minor tail protein [Mycobacterium phage DroogsArmy]
MTTPNQPAPDSLDTLMGVGHFEVGGADTNYGQNIDENFVTDLVTVPFATFGNMLEVLAMVLMRIPAEALKALEPLIPDWIDGGGNWQEGIVGKIIQALDPRRIPYYFDQFEEWLEQNFKPLAQALSVIGGVVEQIINFVQAIVDAIVAGLRGIPILGSILDGIGGLGGAFGPEGKPIDAIVQGVEEAVGGFVEEAIESIPANMYNEWFETTDAEGIPEEVGVTVAAIRTAVAGGFTLQTFTASDPAWVVPDELRNAATAYAGVIGGGGRGEYGSYVIDNDPGLTGEGGKGGSSGGYKVEKFDPSTLGATLAIVVGAAASAVGAHGQPSSIGSLVTSTPNSSGIATELGYQASSSEPGRGGKGGNATTGGPSASTGEAGWSSAAAAGGSGGAWAGHATAGVTAGNGGPGGTGQTSTTPIAGGGGGGGGGGASGGGSYTTTTSGAGGDGGFPGGGSGGSGGLANISVVNTSIVRPPGIPANGMAFLLWR